MDGGPRGRGDLRRCPGPRARLVRPAPDRHRRGRPWRDLPGPDGFTRPGDAGERRRTLHRAGRRLRVPGRAAREVQLSRLAVSVAAAGLTPGAPRVTTRGN